MCKSMTTEKHLGLFYRSRRCYLTTTMNSLAWYTIIWWQFKVYEFFAFLASKGVKNLKDWQISVVDILAWYYFCQKYPRVSVCNLLGCSSWRKKEMTNMSDQNDCRRGGKRRMRGSHARCQEGCCPNSLTRHADYYSTTSYLSRHMECMR